MPMRTGTRLPPDLPEGGVWRRRHTLESATGAAERHGGLGAVEVWASPWSPVQSMAA